MSMIVFHYRYLSASENVMGQVVLSNAKGMDVEDAEAALWSAFGAAGEFVASQVGLPEIAPWGADPKAWITGQDHCMHLFDRCSTPGEDAERFTPLRRAEGSLFGT
jgi:hypothetical protein